MAALALVDPDHIARGDWLHSSCSDELFGRVLRVDYSASPPTVDLLVKPYAIESREDPGFVQNLPVVVPRLHVMSTFDCDAGLDSGPTPRGERTGLSIAFDVPWEGCFRCVALFTVYRTIRREYFARTRGDKWWTLAEDARLVGVS